MPRPGHGHVQQGCVIRRDADRLHGWQASIRRRGVNHAKFFSDARNGGHDGAREAADRWLAEKLATLPPPAAPWVGAVPLPASELGSVRRDGQAMVAEIRRGKRATCSRSIRRYGRQEAERMCWEWLREQRDKLGLSERAALLRSQLHSGVPDGWRAIGAPGSDRSDEA